MRNTQSIILGDGGGSKESAAVSSAISQEEPTISKKVEPLPVSSNGYAQAAAKVNAVNDAIQGTNLPPDKPEVENATPIPSTEPNQSKFRSMGDVTDEMYRSQLPTEEELAKERKREKSRTVIAAIADGVSAISNLYFTGKGAQNVQQTSMSAANAKRYQDILDRRRKMQGEWDNARLAAYDRDRGFEYQKGRDDASWKRSGEWHDDQVKTDNTRFDYNKRRQEKADADNKEYRDKTYELNKKAQENQEKVHRDDSARGWAVVGAQNKRAEAQDRKQRENAKYQFAKLNGSPEPKMITHMQSIYIGRNVWEQNAGQIAGEILRDLRDKDETSAKKFERAMQGGVTGKGISAKDMAALVDNYIMDSPSAQKLAIELEKDYKKRYELATDSSLSLGDDDLGFTPSSSGSGGSVDVDSLFD